MRRAESSASGDAITVTLLPFGGTRQEAVVPEDSTVEHVLEQYGFAGYTARVNGEVANPEDILEDGDTLVLSGSSDKVKGGC